MEDELIAQVASELRADGYLPGVAEALANNGITVETAKDLSKRDVLRYWLEWQGIIGYADYVFDVLENAEANCNM